MTTRTTVLSAVTCCVVALVVLHQLRSPPRVSIRQKAALSSVRTDTVATDEKAEKVSKLPPSGTLISDGEELLDDVQEKANRNPRAAADWCLSHLSPPEQNICLAEAVGTWARKEPRAALDWIAEAGPPEESAALLAHVLSVWAYLDPDSAAEWLKNNPDQCEPGNLLALLAPWMKANENAALEWCLTCLEVVQREAILADLLVAMCSPDPTNTYVLLMDADLVVADGALLAASRTLARNDPVRAKLLADLIIDPQTAAEALTRLETAPSANIREMIQVPVPEASDEANESLKLPEQ